MVEVFKRIHMVQIVYGFKWIQGSNGSQFQMVEGFK